MLETNRLSAAALLVRFLWACPCTGPTYTQQSECSSMLSSAESTVICLYTLLELLQRQLERKQHTLSATASVRSY